jgi:voltage-gated sodium channel
MSQAQLSKLLSEPGLPPWRIKTAKWLETHTIQHTITGIICINAIILGLETHEGIMSAYGPVLKVIDKTCLSLFVLEIALKLIVFRGHFWRSGWSIFDFTVVSISLLPDSGPLSILRALKILRVLRLLTVVTPLRRVTAAFLHAIPGMFSVVGVLCVFFYTMGVVATTIFGKSFPEWFGHLGKSLFTLFQVMTLEGWSMGIVRPVMETYPLAWVFFVPFIIIATFTILNLFVGVIVAAMSELTPNTNPTAGEARIIAMLEQLSQDMEKVKAQQRALAMSAPFAQTAVPIPPTDPVPLMIRQ